MLDAYTIKKMLPRLVIAVILVNLSWYICTSLLATTSTVANALQDLMWQPFEANYERGISIGGQLGLLLWGSAGVAAVPAVLWATIGGGWAVILTSILTIFAFLLLALVILTLREVVLIFLIIISPLALVAWVLPGTEQWAKRWWGLFTKLLLMFPAFMGLLAMGEIMSAITNQNEGGTDADPIGNLIAIVMYVIPFFLLPFLFKAMGGFLGQITGMINDREKGILDRTKGWSKEKTATSDLALQKKLGKANREQRQMGKLARGVGQLDSSAPFSGTRNRWRGSVARRSAGVSLADRAKEAAGIADKSGLNASERVTELRADLKVKVDEEEMKRALQNVKVRISGMDTSAAKAEIQTMFQEAVQRGDGNTIRATMNQMTQLKGVDELNDMQNHVLQTQNPQMMSAWNSGLSENYGDMKAMSPHLAVDFSAKHTVGAPGGPATLADAASTLESDRAKTFTDANLELLSGMKKAGWDRFRASNPAAAARSERDVLDNENLAGRFSG